MLNTICLKKNIVIILISGLRSFKNDRVWEKLVQIQLHWWLTVNTTK